MKKSFSIVGIVLGIGIFFLGLYLALGDSGDGFSGSKTLSYSFGGDYYTEQYEATENAANNILSLGIYLENVARLAFFSVGLILALLGGVIMCHFVCKLSDEKNRELQAIQYKAIKNVSVKDDNLPEL